MKNIKQIIENGETSLGIELGSTRIKAILIDSTSNNIIGYGQHDWENQFENNIWTYSIDAIINGISQCYASLKEYVKNNYSVDIKNISHIGISAMMHGYMAFDKDDNLLVAFRTWRNTTTNDAAKILTEEFDYNIPLRWSIAHLYQAILNNEEHLSKIAYISTLSGFVHYKLTGQKVLGVGDASGMFPILNNDYNTEMVDKFYELSSAKNYGFKIDEIFPKVLVAGTNAGTLTESGAKLLDKDGQLSSGSIFAPPEGDAATGMVATNSITPKTANISAGTSIFSMIVLEKPLSKKYEAVDIVTTPSGDFVAMIHCNNCTSDFDAWVNLFKEFLKALKLDIKSSDVFDTLYQAALNADSDCGGLLSYNYLSGEHNTGFEIGCPLFVRTANSKLNLSNFILTHLYSSLATLKIGMDILLKNENVQITQILGHGGLYKTKYVGQQVTANALNTPVSVMDSAAEGGAYGMAILANFVKENSSQSLSYFLNKKVFSNSDISTVQPEPNNVIGFEQFINRYKKGFEIERAATESMSYNESN